MDFSYQIIETSERALAQRLSAKGTSLTRDDIAVLLADHLKTIEKLQQVQEAGKLRESLEHTQSNNHSARETLEHTHSNNHSARETFSEGRTLLQRRPVSARKLRKLNSGSSESSVVTQSLSELPPIGKSKGANSRQLNSRNKLKAIPLNKLNNTVINAGVVSPESSPDANNRKTYNESGIDSETDETDLHGIEVSTTNLQFHVI